MLDFLLANGESNTVINATHSADRDTHPLLTPQMPVIKQDVGHAMIARINDKPLYVTDRPVTGLDVLASVDLHIAGSTRSVVTG
jgi:hypothetical protein